MIRTKNTLTLALAGFVPTGKLTRAYCGVLPVLALCLATTAWSQTAPTFRGGRVPASPLSGAQPAKAAAATPASAQYRFITIEIPGAIGCGTNYYCDAPFGVNNVRLVTGEYTDSSNLFHGFVWQSGVLQTLDYPGATNTELFFLNDRGVVAASYNNGVANTQYAVTYSFPTGTWTMLPNIPNYTSNYAYDINDAGVAVGEAFGTNSSSWIWDPSSQSYTFIVVPGSAENSTSVDALNDKGQVVGWYADSSGVTHGFLKDGQTYATIDPPDSMLTLANAINDSGTIVGAFRNLSGWWEGFVRTSEGAFTVLSVPGSLETQINGINDRGDICGVSVDPNTGQWTPFVAYKQ
jgi:probable HAF family extracellular repeat protein